MSEEQLTAISGQLSELSDLFRRRLLEDRVARAAREMLERRIAQLEQTVNAEDIRPTVRALAQVVDRIEDNRAEHGTFAESVIEELVDVLESLGVNEVDGGPGFDPRKHVVVTVAGGEGPQLRIIETVRRGWEARGAVLRPASVVVQKTQPAPDGDAGSETG